MKRKKGLVIGAAAAALVAAAVLFSLWIAGLQTIRTTIDIRPCDAVSLQEHMAYYQNIKSGSAAAPSDALVQTQDPFPSDDPADYRDVYISADVKNRSCFKKSISDARLLVSADEQTGVIMTNGSPVTTWVNAFAQEDGIYVAHIMYYCGDKTEEEIEQELLSLRFAWTSNALETVDLQDAQLQHSA